MPVATRRVKNIRSELGGPIREFNERDDVELVDWQIVPQAKHAVAVIEYEEVK
ncbi:hypothetical protein [Haloplanus natans]|uniref:hypothetical protein n=1 Tax=Haloplanus natans TaxID=376171 RepID=UPI0012F762F2|nr:hypothetical protein [Haloplanus natans]